MHRWRREAIKYCGFYWAGNCAAISNQCDGTYCETCSFNKIVTIIPNIGVITNLELAPAISSIASAAKADCVLLIDSTACDAYYQLCSDAQSLIEVAYPEFNWSYRNQIISSNLFW